MKKFTVSLEPSVVKWVIDSSGMNLDMVAQKTGVDRSVVDGWVGTGVMEYSKMGRLADCVKRPEAILFLKSAPDDDELVDYRTAQGAGPVLSPEDRIVVRKARYAQSMAREMMEDRGDSTRPRIRGGITADDSAEEIGEGERGRLHPEGAAGSRGGPRSLYRSLRDAIESLNILVFQRPMDIRGVRGLTLTGRTPYAILVNSKDPDTTKAFTILHEYGHVLLRSGGICSEQPIARDSRPAGQRTESWCNRFAASFLMPRSEFMAERRRYEKSRRDPGKVVKELAEKFKTSRYAAAVRAASLPGSRFRGDYGDMIRMAANRHRPAARNDAKGGPSFVDVRVAQLGRKFVRLVLSSYDMGLINARNAIDCLDMDARHFDGLRTRVHMDE